MVIEDSKEQLTLEQINNVETRIGFTLPNDYKNFLLNHNGGIPTPNEFKFINTNNESSNSLEDFFHSIFEENGEGNLERKYIYLTNSNRIIGNILPIASDPFGNFVCISLDGEDKGKVYFWDHELEPEEPSYENLSLIANSFSEFLNNLE